MSTETEFLAAYERIKAGYAATMAKVDEGIGFEESERAAEAIAIYEDSVKSIEKIFTIPVGLPENVDTVKTEWADACKKIQTLKQVKSEVIYRLKVLRTKNASIDTTAMEVGEEMAGTSTKDSVLVHNPETQYDIQNASGQPKTFKQIIAGLREMIATKDSGVLFDTLFQAQAKLYKIQQSGDVTTIASATSMSLVMCTVGGKWQFLNGTYFLQFTIPQPQPTNISNSLYPNLNSVTEGSDMIWIYPLITNVTNGFRTDYGAIILPDLESETAGDAFGIMLVQIEGADAVTEESLQDQRQFFVDLLEAVLAGTIEEIKLLSLGEDQLYDTSYKISKGIVCTADFIARNVIKGAEKTGELMVKATPYITSKLEPAQTDTQPVSNAVAKTAEVASTVTYAAASMTGWLANKIGSASMAIGQYLAPHIHKQGVALLEKAGYDNAEATNKMEGTFRVIAGAVEGFSTVKDGLETSAQILGKNLGENSVKIIEHKYGSSAGLVANDAFHTLGNVFTVSRNVNYISPKGFAKSIAKTSGKAMVNDYRNSLHGSGHFVAAGQLYPDLRALNNQTNVTTFN